MAIIETFLKLMVERRAERLVLVADRPPFLLLKGEPVELSMPALHHSILQRITHEIAGDQPAEQGEFKDNGGSQFGYRLMTDGAARRIEVHAMEAVPELDRGIDEALTSAAADHVRMPAPAGEAERSSSSTACDPELLALLDLALQQSASDLFLSSGKPPRIRRYGLIVALDTPPPSCQQIISMLPDEAAHKELQTSGSVDFAVTWQLPDGPNRVRINLFKHLDGVAAALRPIRRRAPQLSELSLPDELRQLATFSGGLVLVTGTAGSGKSTTLAAFVEYINHTRQRHIVTIEDPVEYQHREIKSMIHQREVGVNVASFASGLRAALRESPDVILLGEMRDHETIAAALTAAETGHLVLSTLHAGSASTAINRIVDAFPAGQQQFIRTQLSLSLRAVLSQRLLPSRARGMVPAVEKLLVTPAVANGIREGQDHFMRNAMLSGTEEGMITLERSLASLVRDRLIDRDTAMGAATDPSLLHHLLQ